MKIINSKDKAMNSKHWHDPGAKLYDAIKDSESALEEAYLIVGDTGKDVPYSRSGCKYPHHSINDDGDLVVNIDGVIAAYGRAKQMGIFKGEVKSHLMRHYKELGLYKGSKMEKDETITENFNRIEEFLGIDESKYMIESYDNSSIEELESWIDDVAHNGFPTFTENTFREISFEFEEKGINSPQKLLEWMDCIEYDNSIRDWHLRSVGETYFDKKGNCHDQSLFELIALGEMEYPCGQLFFIEVNEGQTVGGNTHTLTWYMDGKQYYWFEHSWENKRGIHGPYHSLGGLEKDVYHEWETDDDINQKEFERIEFWYKPSYKIGMTLGEYVESWTDDESYDESDDESKLDPNFVKKDITAIEYEVIDYNDNHDLCEDYFRRYDIFTSEEAIVYNREKKNGEIIIDKSNDSLIGLVLVFESDGTLTPLKVMPEYRGYGFSDILMRDAVDKYGAKYLGVYADNEVAVELYKKFGFEVYKTKEDEDGTLLFMRRTEPTSIEDTDIMNEYIDGFDEASHGKLKFDFRFGWDYNTGHMVKIVYSLDNIDIVDIGDFYYNNPYKRVDTTKEQHMDYVKKNISKKGNVDHKSKGQKVLAIVDMVTHKNLDSVTLLSPYCSGINTRATSQTKEDLLEARKYADTVNPKTKKVIKKGEIDNDPSFKSTWFSKSINDNKDQQNYRFRQLATAEADKDGRGWKFHNLTPRAAFVYGSDTPYTTYKNPNKKQALQELYIRERDQNNMISQVRNYIAQHPDQSRDPEVLDALDRLRKNLKTILTDIKTIESGKYDSNMMKKYRDKKTGQIVGLWEESIDPFGPHIHNSSDLIEPDIRTLEKRWENVHTLIKDKDKTRFDLSEKINSLQHRQHANGSYDPYVLKQIKSYTAKLDEIDDQLSELKSEERELIYAIKHCNNHTGSFDKRLRESWDIMDMFTEADENDPPELTDENQEDSKPEESPEAPNPDEVPTPPEETSTEQPAEEQPSEEPTEEPSSVEEEPAETEEQPEAPKEEPEKPMSMPKQTDAAEKGKNGVRRKKLYIAFIEWCKAYNNKNTFGSIFDKDIFHNVYPFVPEELRYFYRLANPILCVLGGELTFFQVSELRKVNKNNKDLNKQLIFAATQQDLRVFNNEDKKVYLATEENGSIKLGQVLGDTFDTYIQNMIKQGDILNAPLEGEEVEE